MGLLPSFRSSTLESGTLTPKDKRSTASFRRNARKGWNRWSKMTLVVHNKVVTDIQREQNLVLILPIFFF